MKDFASKLILVEKKVSQLTLAMYNAWELLNEMGYVEMVVYPEKYNENSVREFYANLTTEVGKADSATCGQVFV